MHLLAVKNNLLELKIKVLSLLARHISMLQKEMNHWPWTWRAWERVKYGLMDKALGDIGLHMLAVIAMGAVMPEHLNRRSVSLVVASPPNNGNFSKRKSTINSSILNNDNFLTNP